MIALALAAALFGLDAAIKASVAPCQPPARGEITVCGRRGETVLNRYLPPLLISATCRSARSPRPIVR